MGREYSYICMYIYVFFEIKRSLVKPDEAILRGRTPSLDASHLLRFHQSPDDCCIEVHPRHQGPILLQRGCASAHDRDIHTST
jgi:hypothetical protein